MLRRPRAQPMVTRLSEVATASSGDYAQDYRCGECRGLLTVAWGGSYGINEYVLRCGNDSQHVGIVRPARIPMSQRGLPYIKPSKKEVQRLAQEHGQATSTKLAPYMTSTALTKEQASFIVQTMWPKAPMEMRKQAIALCVMEQLNPLMKHVHILGPYESKKTGELTWALHIGKQANRLMAGRRCDFGYVEERAMTKEEVINVTGEDTYATKLWVVVVVDDDKGKHFTGRGFWWRKDQVYGEEKGNSMFAMAAGRAEKIALDKCTAGRSRTPLPNLPVIDEAFLPDIGQVEEAAAELLADKDTGEVWPFRGKYGDIGKTCPDHLMDWELDNYKGTVSRQHRMPDDPKQFCKLKDILRPIFAEVLAKHGWSEEHFNANLAKPQHGTTWSKLDELDFIALLDELDHSLGYPEGVAPELDGAESPVVPPEAPLEGAAYAAEDARVKSMAERTVEAKPARDPQSLTDINDLFRACHEDFGMQPPAVLKDLGYSSKTDISEKPAEAYLKVKAVRSPAVE